MSGAGRISPHRARRLNDVRRLRTQVSEQDLVRLLALRGHEDVLDLGSGTGFYTDRIAALTTGIVYAVDLQPGMHEQHRERGVPTNVRLIAGDITALPVAPMRAGPTPVAGVALQPHSVDLACTIAVWHEINGKLDLQGLATVLRPDGRVVVVDWRKDPESWESGPPREVRSSKEETAHSLASYFTIDGVEDLGRFMFAVAARLPKAVPSLA